MKKKEYTKSLTPHLDAMYTFTLKDLPDLDEVVLAALELFSSTPVPKIRISYKRPLVVGSGNAEATGRILFSDKDAVFASESNFEEKLKSVKSIDGVVIVSASGGKHAPIIARVAKRYKKKVTLITTTEDSEAARVLTKNDGVFVFPKNREPYTYNTSTYLGMILGKTQEDPRKIQRFIEEKISTLKLPKLKQYDKFVVILPAEFSSLVPMVETKFIELFGREYARDVFTTEHMKHATTVTPSKKELFISFGEKNTTWGRASDRLHIPLPKNADYACALAVSYYVVGQLQKVKPDYFKKNIQDYTKMISHVFGHTIKPIVS